ncbi:MAG: alpha-galactosidase [Clostridia bacterium]|nr:alpha-galactosidase [Clostridia bacterium]
MNTLMSNGWELIVNGSQLLAAETDSYKLTSFSSFNDSFQVLKTADVFVNKSQHDIEINKILNQFILKDDITKVIYQTSAWCHENETMILEKVEHFQIKSSGTRTTQEFNPFIIIETEKMNYSIHLLPVGDWEININRMTGREAAYLISLGLKSENLHMTVKSESVIYLPECLIQFSKSKDIYANAMNFHRYLNENFKKSEKKIPIVYNSWFYDFDKFTVDDLKEQVKAAKLLGMEAFVVDAGWYGPSNDDWYQAAGDWREKTNGAFYEKMKAFSDYIISEGLSFGLWIEPERICEGVPVLFEHPDYFIKSDNGHYYHDLTKQKVRQFFYDTISSLIDQYQVTWLKIDYNFPLANDCYHNHFYSYIYYLYQIMRELREKYPNVVFEGCESGAMRFDLKSNQHYDVHFLSDNVNPADALTIYMNSLLRMSPNSIYKWVVIREIGDIPQYTRPLKEARRRLITPKGATWEAFESVEASFILALAVSGYPGFSGDIASLTGDNIKTVKKFLDVYKENRELIRNCHAYVYHDEDMNIKSFEWKAYHLSHQYNEKILLFCYRLDSSEENCIIKMKEIDATRNYLVKHSQGKEMTVSGEELIHGLSVNLKGRYTAELIEIKII